MAKTRKLTIQIPISLLDQLEALLNLWGKIYGGCLIEDIVHDTGAKTYPDARSQIIKHMSPDGKQHIATTHRILQLDGVSPHWHVKDLVVDEIKVSRLEQPRRDTI